MMPFLYLISGFLLAGVGGEAFVRGSVGLSRSFRIPAAIVGVTVAAFATSSPELSVAINASLAGKPNISLGDSLGSIVVNISLVLGITLCYGPLTVARREIRRDWIISLLAPVMIAFFALDGEISRWDGIILLLQFSVWLAWVIADTRKHMTNAPASEGSCGKAILLCIAGTGLLIGAGLSIVSGAKGIGQMFSVPTFVIGATLVALGTSIPELATTLIARMRGQNELGLNTVLGSNVFNVFVIVAVAAVIHPITVTLDSLLVVLGFCLFLTLMTWPSRSGIIPRGRGFIFVFLYLCYVVFTLMTGKE